jgi:hypothetical protein
MTVKQLIQKLQKLPEDAIVCIPNNSLYVDGIYRATETDFWDEDGFVVIDSDHKRKEWEE